MSQLSPSISKSITFALRDFSAWAIKARSRSLLMGVLLFVIFFAVLAGVQFSTPNLPDNDGYYHIRLAWLMRTEGLKPEFPWLPLSILNPREYVDHHFLYHVALIPFTLGDLRLGAKLSAVLFASLAFLVFWRLLAHQRIPYSSLWALGLLAVSAGFLYRLSITRAQSLSLLILLLGVHWLLVGKYRLLLPLSFVYVWAYNAFPLMLMIAVVYAAAVLLAERRLVWQPVAYVAVGVGLGLFINPYFPDNLVFVYRHILPKLVETTEIRVGVEWYPYSTTQLVDNAMLGLALFVSGMLALGLRGERMETRTAFALLLALMFGFMLLQSRRFVEYFPAFALLFAAFAWSPLIQRSLEQASSAAFTLFNRPFRLPAWSVQGVMVAVLLAGMYQALPGAIDSMKNAKPYQLYAAASQWLAEHTEPGERIFQTDWDDFPRLFYYNQRNTYLAGLDPTYLQMYDPNLYDLWVKVTQGKIDHPSQVIAQDFAARFVISDLNHAAFEARAKADPQMVEVYRDDGAVVYQVLP